MTEENKRPLVITKLEAENIKRIRAVCITPDGSPLVVIGGKNAQGKTSTLDAIEMALGGGSTIPPEPIRRGARKAKATVELGEHGKPPEFIVERGFSASGGPTLVVKNAAGVPQKSPQGLLDAICASVSFDPFAFTRLKPQDQDKILKDAIGLDLTEIDARQSAAYENRKLAKRDLKEEEARFSAMPEHAGVPKAEVSVAELSKTLAIAREHAHARSLAAQAVTMGETTFLRAEAEVVRCQAQLKAAEEVLAKERNALSAAREALADLAPDKDTTELEQQIATAEETNRKVRENLARAAKNERIKTLEKLVEQHDTTVKDCDDEKQKLLAAAKFPVPGLGFDESGPTLDGVPLQQASSAEQLRVSVALGLALNPRLKVLLIREGSLLDSDKLRELAEIAQQAGAELWIEKVSEDGAGCSVVISDGQVVGANP